MKVLVTGGAGYVGSVLVAALVDRGYQVRVVDALLWGDDHLPAAAEVVRGDVCSFDPAWLEGVEAVLHLAGLSNDPMAEHNLSLNFTLNAAGTATAAALSKRAGIRRFIFASTCSVYGYTAGQEMDETAPVRPAYPYAISKLMAEKALECLQDEGFWPIILREGTVIGWSSRMRYDLVVNTMIKSALTQGKIQVHNPSLWRPLIDVRDVAQAYIRALDAAEGVWGVFNILYDNYTIGRLADEVAGRLKTRWGVSVPVAVQRRQDVRNYRVSWQKAYEYLDFRARYNMADAVDDIMEHIAQGGPGADLENPRYINVEWLKVKEAESRQ